MRRAVEMWSKVVGLVTGEWLLTRLQFPNGGAIILLRSLWVSTVASLCGLGVQNALDPTRTWSFSHVELTGQLSNNTHWYATILGAVYVAFYSRFASQWSYLANLYNQIKAAECRKDCNQEKVAEWKAGFIVDAGELHLASKSLFHGVIQAWKSDPAVETALQTDDAASNRHRRSPDEPARASW